MSVITISREFGSQGDTIAERIAQSLGYHFVDKEFIGTVLAQYGLAEFDREYETMPGFWEKFNAQREKRRDVMVDMLNQVVRAVAQHGNVVILGRSGFAVLAGFADVLHVRLQAPLILRVERVMVQQELPFDQAGELVKDNDKVRRAFIEEFYRVPWESIRAFDLVVNTEKISPDMAVTWIIDAAKAFVVTPNSGKLTTGSIEVDPVLAKTISDELHCTTLHR